jgi:AraC-like DNA-binding protein/mannose-6-phosphate isomerase-like protein (cupin superfamily)
MYQIQLPKSRADGKQRLNLDQTGLEYKKWKDGTAFPVSTGLCDLSAYCNNAFDFHWHDGPELTVVVQGRMDYMVNDKSYHMEVGDCVFANSNAMHSGRMIDDEGCIYLVVSFLTSAIDSDAEGAIAQKYFGGVMDSDRLPAMFFEAEGETYSPVAQLCTDIYHAYKDKGELWELEIKSLLCQLWMILRREASAISETSDENSTSVARIKKAIRYMKDNYHTKISLDDIARSCNLSKSEFCRCFKRITRQTPFDYLIDLRIRKSIRLLEAGGCTVTEAAMKSGFTGSSYYTEVFRRYMNCTPREYMKRARRN